MMKNNYIASNNHKVGFVVLLLLFFGLFVSESNAQSGVATLDTFIWTGTKSTNWADAANWTIIRGSTTAGSNTYPGELGTTDVVFINKNDAPFAPILDGQVIDIARLNVANTFGTESGAVLTINAGAQLTVGNNTAQSNNVLLNGGNIVNNGFLNIKATGIGSTGFPVVGINCGNPNVLPAVPREYGYSGSGTLSISLSAANFAGGAAAIALFGNNNPVTTNGVTVTPPITTANVTYKFILNNPTITFNQATLLGIGAIRAAGGNNANKLIIGGTGFTLENIDELTGARTPTIGGLLSMNGGASVTIEAGTTLNLNSAITNPNGAIGGFSANTFPVEFTNNGTINITGASARSGMGFSTSGSATAAFVYNINNPGTLNIDLNMVNGATGAFSIGDGGSGAANAGSVVNINNTGTMIWKNRSTAVGTGFPIYTTTAAAAPRIIINNSGNFNIEGSTYSYGLKTIVNNTGLLNSNSEFRGFTEINNNGGGRINFARTAATATSRLASFTIVTAADVSGGAGSIYRDSNNNDFVIVAQKFGGSLSLLANVISNATVPATGTLTRITGTGTAAIAYTAVSLSPLNSAATGTVRNSGIIKTDTASNLNILPLVSSTATSVLSPGGDNGRGILTIPDFPAAAADLLALNGTLKIQATGSATAGVDYDMMQITGASDILDIAGATLDVTGLYTPSVLTTIDIITTFIDTSVPLSDLANKSGSVVGDFASIVGLPAKWTVVYTRGLGSKVQLVYDPALNTETFANFNFNVYPNPTTNILNVSAANNISKIELYNIVGQKVRTQVIDATQSAINVSDLQNGVYIMEVTIENAKQAFKIVKQ